MMKKHLFLRLCLMFLIGVSAFSCRTEEFHNEEEAHGSTGLRLTSQRISLNESKHKAQLFTEIDKAENTLKGFTKVNVHGKMVDYGNGVSIDTDHVIYIENGPNYHTYTFKINRDNAPADAPLENLLLSPLADGSYQEFLITYHLTALEKEKLMNGEPVDTKGKKTITKLAKGTFNSGGQLAKMTCNWQETTVWQGCSQIINGVSMHNQSNVSDWHKCKAATPPSVYTVITGGCIIDQPTPVDHVIAPPEAGPGGGENTDPGTPPQDCISVATDPTQVGLVSSTGCYVGIVTEPNNPDDPDERTPCEVLKENSQTPYIQTKLDSLKERVALTTTDRDKHETGITIEKRGQVLKHKVFKKPKETGIPGVVAVEIQLKTWDILAAHNHYEGTFPVPQFGDILTFYSGYKIAAPPRKNAYTNYVVNFNGIEYAFRMSDTTALDALLAGLNYDTTQANPTTEQEKEANRLIYKIFLANGFKEDKDYTEDEALKILMKVLNDPKIGSGNGVHLYQRNKDTKRWAKLKLKADGTVGKDDCPL